MSGKLSHDLIQPIKMLWLQRSVNYRLKSLLLLSKLKFCLNLIECRLLHYDCLQLAMLQSFEARPYIVNISALYNLKTSKKKITFSPAKQALIRQSVGQNVVLVP